ncbi:MAG TPA: hypothetical protein VE152_08625 [Acidimicrobiales bacterium]|nr:hypothetical protein [Acidimicrobiales bacterium]
MTILTSPEWGPWELELEAFALAVDLEAGGSSYRYEVDLKACTSSAQVLDWLGELAGKAWADDRTVAGLVRALNDLLDLQTTLCPWGQDRTITGDQVEQLVRERAPYANPRPAAAPPGRGDNHQDGSAGH